MRRSRMGVTRLHEKGNRAATRSFRIRAVLRIWLVLKMAVNAPVLVTRAHIGKGPGIVLISFSAPAGELGKGSVENVEVVRIAMTHSTFKEFAGLFSYTLGELGMGEPVAPVTPEASHEAPRRFERGSSRARPVAEKT